MTDGPANSSPVRNRPEMPWPSRSLGENAFGFPLTSGAAFLTRSTRFPGSGIEEQATAVARTVKVKHLGDGIGNCVKRPLPNSLSAQEVVLDEAQHGGLVGRA